jgi:hypothetical protein
MQINMEITLQQPPYLKFELKKLSHFLFFQKMGQFLGKSFVELKYLFIQNNLKNNLFW